jgi:hypothetical protein
VDFYTGLSLVDPHEYFAQLRSRSPVVGPAPAARRRAVVTYERVTQDRRPAPADVALLFSLYLAEGGDQP